MCIKSSKNSPFLKTSSLNPTAQEWRPPHLHRHHPAPPPPPLTAALVAHPPPKQLLWHFLPQPQCFFHLYSLPPPLPLPPPPPLPLIGGEGNDVSQLEEKRVVKCLEKLERLIVKARCEMPKRTPPPLPERWVWRPKTSLASAAAAPPPPASPLLEGQSSRTTVMLKNIPNQLRRDFMLEFLDSYCREHLLEYDFMYLPMDFRSKDNLGYAFVNFTNGENALKFKKILHGYKWRAIKTDNGVYTSKKICAITWARIQGKEKLVERFESSIFRCDNPNFLPVVFDPPRGGSNATSPVIVGRVSHAT